MRVVVAPLAAQDLGEAYEFISRDNPDAADRILAALSEVMGKLASGHLRGREVRLKSGETVLAWSHPPYRIYHRLKPDELQVVRVYHQARRPIEE